MAAELKRLKEANAALQRKYDASDAAHAQAHLPQGTAPMDTEQGDGWLVDAIAAARRELKAMQDVDEAVRPHIDGGWEARVANLKAKLAQAQAARRAANPLQQQLEGAEAFKHRMVERADKAKAALASKEEEVQDLSAQVEVHRKSLAEADAAVAQATAQVADLAKRFASECAPATGPGQPAAAAAPPPGYVALEFA